MVHAEPDPRGTLRKNYSAPEVGTYNIKATTTHGSDTGEDADTFVVEAEITIEFPAPPAQANMYLNQTYAKKLLAQCRDNIIVPIALNHAQQSKYGPKGGPYNFDLILSQ